MVNEQSLQSHSNSRCRISVLQVVCQLYIPARMRGAMGGRSRNLTFLRATLPLEISAGGDGGHILRNLLHSAEELDASNVADTSLLWNHFGTEMRGNPFANPVLELGVGVFYGASWKHLHPNWLNSGGTESGQRCSESAI